MNSLREALDQKLFEGWSDEQIYRLVKDLMMNMYTIYEMPDEEDVAQIVSHEEPHG